MLNRDNDDLRYTIASLEYNDVKTRIFWNNGTILFLQITWALFQYPIRRLILRSSKVSKPWYLYLELCDGSEIWQAPRQHCCRGACQISKWYNNLNYQSHGFESSRDLTIRHLIGYWNGALVPFIGMAAATIVLIMQEKQVLVFHKEGFQLPVPSQWLGKG